MNIYNQGLGRRPRTRLRKRNNGTASFHYEIPRKFSSLKVKHSSSFSRGNYGYKGDGALYGGLHKAWLGYVIAQSQNDYEQMRKYAIAIQKFERLLNIEINEFCHLDLYTSDAFENRAENDDSQLRIVDPWSEDGKDDLADDNYHQL
jgi:hypothetical protein